MEDKAVTAALGGRLNLEEAKQDEGDQIWVICVVWAISGVGLDP